MKIEIYNVIFKICFTTSFIISSLFSILIACILYLTVRPFNKTVYRSILWYLLLAPYAHVAFLSDWWSLLKLKLYMNKDDYQKYFSKEHALVIINHSYDIDWLPLISICARKKILCNIRVFVKKSLQYLPIIGWSFIFTEYILLHRSYEKDKEIIKDAVKDIGKYPYPIWLVLYPEGTWFTKESHNKSQEYAEKMDLPQLEYHLQPKTNGFITTVTEMRGHIQALYNIEIAFENGETKPCSSSIIQGKQITAHIYVKRYAEEEIPTQTEEQKLFLRKMFQIKDKLLGSFKKSGSFFEESDVPVEIPLKLERPFYIIPTFLGSCIIVISLMLYWTVKFYISYGSITIFIVVTTISMCCFVLNIAMRSTKIEKGP